MRRLALAAFTAGVLVFVVAAVVPFLTRSRDLPASVPSPPPLVSVALDVIAPGATLCMGNIAAERHSQEARFKVGTYKKTGQPLLLTVTAPGYRTQARLPGGYADNLQQALRIQPPPRAELVTACIRNEGSQKVALYAAGDRAKSRVPVIVGGRSQSATPTFGFWEARRASLADRLGPTVARIATFRGLFGVSAFVWLLLAAFFAGMPLLLALAIWRAFPPDSGG